MNEGLDWSGLRPHGQQQPLPAPTPKPQAKYGAPGYWKQKLFGGPVTNPVKTTDHGHFVPEAVPIRQGFAGSDAANLLNTTSRNLAYTTSLVKQLDNTNFEKYKRPVLANLESQAETLKKAFGLVRKHSEDHEQRLKAAAHRWQRDEEEQREIARRKRMIPGSTGMPSPLMQRDI